MFVQADCELVTGRWVRATRTVSGTLYSHLFLVKRAWVSSVLYAPDGSMGMMVFEPNTKVLFTAFHLPADGAYEVLPGCADIDILKPYLGAAVLQTPACPSGSQCVCLTGRR